MWSDDADWLCLHNDQMKTLLSSCDAKRNPAPHGWGQTGQTEEQEAAHLLQMLQTRQPNVYNM